MARYYRWRQKSIHGRGQGSGRGWGQGYWHRGALATPLPPASWWLPGQECGCEPRGCLRKQAQAYKSPGPAGHQAGTWLRELLCGCDRIPARPMCWVWVTLVVTQGPGEPSGPRTEPADAEPGQSLPHWELWCPPPYSPIPSSPCVPFSCLLLPPLWASSPFLSSLPAAQCPLPQPACSHSPVNPGPCLLPAQGRTRTPASSSVLRCGDTVEAGACRCPGMGGVQGKGERLQRGRGFSSGAQPRGEGA